MPTSRSSNISNSIKKSPKRRKMTADLISNVKSAVYLSILNSKNYRNLESFYTYIEKTSENQGVFTLISKKVPNFAHFFDFITKSLISVK